MKDTGWLVADDGYDYVRQIGPVFLRVQFRWGGCEWEVYRAVASPRRWHRFGINHRTVALAKRAAMRVAKRWLREEAAE